MLNYIALLGWSPKGENEIFTLAQMIEEFDVAGISKSPAIFDPLKLRHINGEYIRMLSIDDFARMAEPWIRQTVTRPDVDIKLIAQVLQARTEVLADIPEQVDFIDSLPDYDLEMYVSKKMKTTRESSLEMLKAVLPVLEGVDDFTIENIHAAVFALIESLGVKNGIVLWPLRVAASGKQFTPGGGIEICAILGKDEALARVKKGIALLAE